ncbi:serine/threonine protein kinase [Streptomyces actinomycinicus]|uniref:non-specific serine/threonine protein kinase n=1 Tax=Streptomyces actinomycinicus TaxID=1695166 RepID=A0A937EGM2_9ACTN|nr:serine/threonine-protein kinase [Streptomyces actinomycinicus]MBL1082431.1 serine/threonine protein kinase [Streptomyces actinomycinicus]
MSEAGSDNSGRRVVDGRFELEKRLGGGGMGMVWLARDLVLHRNVAVKEVRPPDPDLAEYDPEAARMLRERVLREARALARVDHPNVVTIHHIVDGGPGTYPWLVMELVTGGSLADRLARGPMDPPEAALIGREVLAALRAAHEVGIQHRDVKPANVLLRPDGRPVLTDFGIAAIRESTALTATGSIIGTADYMAPERVSGQDGGPASDLWSLGMMLYAAVEGRHPLRRGTTLATLAAVLSEEIPPPVRAGALTDVLQRLLVRDPAARPGATELERMLDTAAQAAGTTPTSYPLQPPPAAPAPGSAAPGPALGATAPGFGPPPAMPTGPYDARPAHTMPAGPEDARPPAMTAPVPVRPGPRRRRVLVGLPIAGVALAGALIGTLWPEGDAEVSSSSGRPKSAGTSSRSPSHDATAHSAAPAGKEQTDTGETDTGEADKGGTGKGDLLTPAGVRTAVAALKKESGRDRFGSLTVYPQYAIAEMMVDGSDTKYDTYTYRVGQGVEKGIISGKLPSTESPVSLDGFDWNAVPALLSEAEKKLNVDHVTTRYLVLNTPDPVFGDPAGMSVYLSNAYSETGYLEADPKGKVRKVMPNDG